MTRAEAAQRRRTAAAVLRTLPAAHREVAVLAGVCRYRPEQVAFLLGITETAASARIQAAAGAFEAAARRLGLWSPDPDPGLEQEEVAV